MGIRLVMAMKGDSLSALLKSPSISVVVTSHNEGTMLFRTVNALIGTLPEDSEVIVVDDWSTDHSTDDLVEHFEGVTLVRPPKRLGVACARNYGAARASGQIIVFSDGHVDVPIRWWEPLIADLEDPSVGSVGPGITAMGRPGMNGYGMYWKRSDLRADWLDLESGSRHHVPLLCGGFTAMRRETIEAVGGFDDGMVVYGSEDLELSLRLWLLGYTVLVEPEVIVAHQFRERHPYQVQWATYLYNLLRMIFAHFNSKRIGRLMEEIRQYQDFSTVMGQIADSNIWLRRAQWMERRMHDDDWFFERFQMNF